MRMSKSANALAVSIGAAALSAGSASAQANNAQIEHALQTTHITAIEGTLPKIGQSFEGAREIAATISTMLERNPELAQRLVENPMATLRGLGLEDIWAEAFARDLGFDEASIGECCVTGGCKNTCGKTC